MTSMVSDTGQILEEMYKILEKYKLEKLINNITMYWNKNETIIASIIPKYIEKKQCQYYTSSVYENIFSRAFSNKYQTKNQPNFYCFVANRQAWTCLSNLGKQHVVAHETAHIIDQHHHGLLNIYGNIKPNTELHGENFMTIMSQLGYPETHPSIILDQDKYWTNRKYRIKLSI